MRQIILTFTFTAVCFGQTPINPGSSIQAAVDANPNGTVFLLRAGVHRQQAVRPKPGWIGSNCGWGGWA